MPNSSSIMIVDDDHDIALLFSLHLTNFGFDTNSFTDPRLALDHFIQNPSRYSLILLDSSMAKLDGIELAKVIRKYNSQVMILLVTASPSDKVFQTKAFNYCKISEVIQKPIMLEDLSARIFRLCSKHKNTN